jgi:hypothetical protein
MEAIYPQLEAVRQRREERKSQFFEPLDAINSILREIKPYNTPLVGMDESDLSVRKLTELKSQLEYLRTEKVHSYSLVPVRGVVSVSHTIVKND